MYNYRMLSRFIFIFSLFFLFCQKPLFAQALPKDAHPLEAKISLNPNSVFPGGESKIKLDLTIYDEFFVYEDKIKLHILEPEETLSTELNISPIIDFKDVVSGKIKKGLKKSGTIQSNIVFPASLNPSLRELIVELEYVACTAKYCLLPKRLEVRLPVQVTNAPSMQEKSTQKATSLKESLTSEEGFKELLGSHFFFALFGIFLFGILTSFTPCIYPLIPITMMVLGSNDDRPLPYRFSMSLLYVLGIAITYAALGVFAAASGGLFGSFAGHPVVLAVMSITFLLMGLSLFGLFEIKTPAIFEKHLKKYEKTSGPLGTFISGCLAGVIAGPCVGPILVGILAYIAHQRDLVLGFFLLFIFALGFGLLFIALGTFIHLKEKLPKSGAWMVLVKYFIGLIMIGFSIWYARPLLGQVVGKFQSKTTDSGPSWEKYSEEKIAAAKTNGQPVLLDFYADWCLACVEMDKFTFSQDSVQQALKDFVLVKIDATKDYPGLRDLQTKYEVYGLPSYIFIAPDGQIIEEETLTGFEKADPFIERIQRFLKKTTP